MGRVDLADGEARGSPHWHPEPQGGSTICATVMGRLAGDGKPEGRRRRAPCVSRVGRLAGAARLLGPEAELGEGREVVAIKGQVVTSWLSTGLGFRPRVQRLVPAAREPGRNPVPPHFRRDAAFPLDQEVRAWARDGRI